MCCSVCRTRHESHVADLHRRPADVEHSRGKRVVGEVGVGVHLMVARQVAHHAARKQEEEVDNHQNGTDQVPQVATAEVEGAA